MRTNARVYMGKKQKQKRKKGRVRNKYQHTQTKEVTLEEESDSEREISLEDAQKLRSLSKLGATWVPSSGCTCVIRLLYTRLMLRFKLKDIYGHIILFSFAIRYLLFISTLLCLVECDSPCIVEYHRVPFWV